ncbi:MAG: hypothetical protein OEO84_05560, partial [Betaproteobacteria bacterium]|nr:hypothetical protein [Betaproteobacteria bacterium]
MSAHRAMLIKIALATGLSLMLMLANAPSQAEYGDVILNQQSEKNGVRPVVFPHWFHRIRFQCKVCHGELEFKMRAGTTETTMADIMAGKFCGKCHNGTIAWATDRCDLCHSGLPGRATAVVGGNKT